MGGGMRTFTKNRRKGARTFTRNRRKGSGGGNRLTCPAQAREETHPKGESPPP